MGCQLYETHAKTSEVYLRLTKILYKVSTFYLSVNELYNFSLTLLQHGQTVADFIQRLVCKYGDESGTPSFPCITYVF